MARLADAHHAGPLQDELRRLSCCPLLIDRLVHHADVVASKGDSYRLKDRDLGRVPAASNEDQ